MCLPLFFCPLYFFRLPKGKRKNAPTPTKLLRSRTRKLKNARRRTYTRRRERAYRIAAHGRRRRRLDSPQAQALQAVWAVRAVAGAVALVWLVRVRCVFGVVVWAVVCACALGLPGGGRCACAWLSLGCIGWAVRWGVSWLGCGGFGQRWHLEARGWPFGSCRAPADRQPSYMPLPWFTPPADLAGRRAAFPVSSVCRPLPGPFSMFAVCPSSARRG